VPGGIALARKRIEYCGVVVDVCCTHPRRGAELRAQYLELLVHTLDELIRRLARGRIGGPFRPDAYLCVASEQDKRDRTAERQFPHLEVSPRFANAIFGSASVDAAHQLLDRLG